MLNSNLELVCRRPPRREVDSPAVAGARSFEIFVLAAPAASGGNAGYDNWAHRHRLGFKPRPQAAIFRFYFICRWILGGASLYGLRQNPLSCPSRDFETFVTHARSLRRVMQCSYREAGVPASLRSFSGFTCYG